MELPPKVQETSAFEIQAELQKLILGNKKNDTCKLQCTAAAVSSFVRCTKSIAEAALLHYPADSTKPLALLVDTLNITAGAVLQPVNTWEPLGFYSEKFSKLR